MAEPGRSSAVERVEDGSGRGSTRARALAISTTLHRQYGEASLGNLDDPIDELVYISLTRQTHRRNAGRSWEAVTKIGGARQLVDTDEDELATLFHSSGFSRQKARWIKQSLEIIRDEMGELSLARAEVWSNEKLERFLCSLPGISIKSAKCIMLYSLGRKVLPVDTHVRRVATRVGLVPAGLSERRIHAAIEDVVPAPHRRSLHINLIWHGRRVCTALRPRCSECVVRELCDLGSSKQATAEGAVA